MPSASDGPCSPHQGRTRPGPSRTEQAPEQGPVGSQIHTPQGCAKGPRVPSTTTERQPWQEPGGRPPPSAPRVLGGSPPCPRHGASLEFSCWLAAPVATKLTNNGLATWLILPVVICLSQRLSHACLSTSLTKVKPRMAH